MKRIEKPNWYVALNKLNTKSLNDFGYGISNAQQQWLEEWFRYKCEPINQLIDGAVAVYSSCEYGERHWSNIQNLDDRQSDKYKALLIGVEPIKKDTAEDVLREFIENVEVRALPGILAVDEKYEKLAPILHRAKAVLENKE